MMADDEATVHRLEIPYTPRPQFLGFHARTERQACIVAHRRAGKTVATIRELERAALRSTNVRPRFGFISPYLSQSKAVAWDYLRESLPLLGRFGAQANESELRVDYPNGSRVRLYGADNPDTLRGQYFDGVVLDEFADHDPRILEVIRPTLTDRKGWIVYIGTPRGHNAFYDIYRRSLKEPGWYSLVLKASETGLLDAGELEQAKKDLSEEQYAQEFECSFDSAILGAYYGKQLAEAQSAGRICGVPYDTASQVWTSWDLGIRDATAIWFAQRVGREVHVIDYYEASGADLGHYVKELNAKPYQYAGHIVPHDAQAKELGTGKSRLEVLGSLGLRNITVAPQHRVEDGINGVRVFLPRCWIDAKNCDRGIEALKIYRAEFDLRLKTLKRNPVHDWSSHAADSFRYLAMTFDNLKNTSNFYRRIQYPPSGKI